MVEGAKQILALSLSMAFGGVDVPNEAHGLTSVASKLGLGLPNLLHVLEAVVALDGMFFLNSVSLPRVGRCVVFGS